MEPKSSIFDQFKLADGMDMWEGLKRYGLWSHYAIDEVKDRYRRTVLGPFWITIGLGSLVFMVGFIYPSIFGTTVDDYMPYVSAGFVSWFFISNTIIESVDVFNRASQISRQIRLPYTVFVYVGVFRNTITYFHYILVYLVVVLFFGQNWDFATLMLLPGLAIFTVFGVGAGVVLGILGARYRDVSQLTATGMQIMFFMTPVFWRTTDMANRSSWIELNPLFHFVQILRAPLLGGEIPWESFLFTSIFSSMLLILAFILLCRFRRRLILWL